MRRTLCLLGLFLVILPARADTPPTVNALTAEESAEGWSLLFDGEQFTGFQIQGDYEVKDGILVLGGKTTTRLTISRVLVRNFELRLEFRTERAPGRPVGSEATAGMIHREVFGSGTRRWGFASSPSEQEPKPWGEIVFHAKYDAESDTQIVTRQTVKSKSALSPGAGEEQNIWMGRPTAFTAFLEVPPGNKLYLRNVKLKADPVGWWDTPWPYLAILVAGLLTFCLMLWIVWRILRRRWAMADVRPPV